MDYSWEHLISDDIQSSFAVQSDVDLNLTKIRWEMLVHPLRVPQSLRDFIMHVERGGLSVFLVF